MVGIYIHIPFCQHKCGYCDFYSLPYSPGDSVYRQFVNALLFEITLRRSEIPDSKIQTVYIGGGTPSLLTAHQLAQIFSHLKNLFDLDELQEFTVEINPGTVDKEKLLSYREIGITRLSIGVQAFQNHLLQRLDRIHSAEEAEEVILSAHAAEFANINLDFIFGIQGQTLQDWQASLQRAVNLSPTHLSIYNVTYEEGTPFYKMRQSGQIKPLDAECEEIFYNFGVDFLSQNGFSRYEISNYSKPGFAGEHNLTYWNYRPYLGFGPSAHSFDGKKRRWNLPDLNRYLQALNKRKLPPFEEEKIDRGQQLEEWLFLQMRQTKGLDLDPFYNRFSLPKLNWPAMLQKSFGPGWQVFLRLDGNNLSFTTKGFWLSDEILPRLLLMLQSPA
ncbi:MAG TPA: radical SAM family heme chaperone HemW [Bacteroidetes bacterium]|nr:radical SAM family heme chaperone HemW [Bacteroidota bacterium]